MYKLKPQADKGKKVALTPTNNTGVLVTEPTMIVNQSHALRTSAIRGRDPPSLLPPKGTFAGLSSVAPSQEQVTDKSASRLGYDEAIAQMVWHGSRGMSGDDKNGATDDRPV